MRSCYLDLIARDAELLRDERLLHAVGVLHDRVDGVEQLELVECVAELARARRYLLRGEVGRIRVVLCRRLWAFRERRGDTTASSSSSSSCLLVRAAAAAAVVARVVAAVAVAAVVVNCWRRVLFVLVVVGGGGSSGRCGQVLDTLVIVLLMRIEMRVLLLSIVVRHRTGICLWLWLVAGI